MANRARKTALKREVEVKKMDDGSHGHVCPHCSKSHRHVDPKCYFIGLAYLSCPECLKIGQSFDVVKEDDIILDVAQDFEEAVKAVDPGDTFEEYHLGTGDLM